MQNEVTYEPYNWKKVVVINVVVVSLIVSGIFSFFAYQSQKKEQIDVSKYVDFSAVGVEGASGIILDYGYGSGTSKSYTEERAVDAYIRGLQFEINGVIFPTETSEVSGLYGNKLFTPINLQSGKNTIRIVKNEPLNIEYGFVPKDYEIPFLIRLDTIVKAEALTASVLKEHYNRMLEYNSVYTNLQPEAIEAGELTKIYYKEQPYTIDGKTDYEWDGSTLRTETSGFTVLYGLKYQGKLYFVGETNTINFGSDINEISYLSGDFYDEANLELTDAQRSVENIDQVMRDKGYQEYVI